MTWPTKKLGEVTLIMNGGTPNTKRLEYWNGENLWLTPRELANFHDIEITDTERKISASGLKNSSARLLPIGTVLLTSRAPIGYVAIAGVSLATNQGFKNFICDERFINNRFLYYFFVLKTQYLKSLGRGATFTEVSKDIVSKVKISLPPLSIQKQIVEKLDKIAEARKMNDELIQKADELFQSLLYQELNPENNKDWKIEKLEDIIVDSTNGFASRPVVKGVGQLRPNNIDSMGTLNFLSIKFVPENYRNIKNYFLKKDDILFNNTNSVELVGKTTFIDKDYDYVFSNHMTRIQVDGKRVDPQFLVIFLQRL